MTFILLFQYDSLTYQLLLDGKDIEYKPDCQILSKGCDGKRKLLQVFLLSKIVERNFQDVTIDPLTPKIQ
jgi:hypothetical protein